MHECSRSPPPLLPSIPFASIMWGCFLLHGLASRQEKMSNTYNKLEMERSQEAN